MPETGSSPIVASQSPRSPATRPFKMASPESEATNVMPSRASMKNSGEPNVSTSGRTIGIARASTIAPNAAPNSELMIAAPSALPVSPFFAIAWPSTIVAAVVGSPGMPKRIDVMSPVVLVTAAIPRRNANASTGFILKMNGSMSASVVGPPRPGRMPTAKPIRIPTSIRPKAGQPKTCASPVKVAWRNSINQDAPEPRDEGRLEREEPVHRALDVLAADRVDVELRPLRFGEERRVAQRLLKRLAESLHPVFRRARRQRVGADQ